VLAIGQAVFASDGRWPPEESLTIQRGRPTLEKNALLGETAPLSSKLPVRTFDGSLDVQQVQVFGVGGPA
jgi:hypothetical protein